MRSSGVYGKAAGFLAAVALCTSSTGAIAASTSSLQQAGLHPLIALSALGSDASRAALCGAAAAAAAGAAMAAQAPAQGCVLPIVDAPPAVAVNEPLPPPPVAPPPVPATGGFGVSPLLLGLAGLALAALLATQLGGGGDDDDDDSETPPV